MYLRVPRFSSFVFSRVIVRIETLTVSRWRGLKVTSFFGVPYRSPFSHLFIWDAEWPLDRSNVTTSRTPYPHNDVNKNLWFQMVFSTLLPNVVCCPLDRGYFGVPCSPPSLSFLGLSYRHTFVGGLWSSPETFYVGLFFPRLLLNELKRVEGKFRGRSLGVTSSLGKLTQGRPVEVPRYSSYLFPFLI